ncbi:DUF6086 family protein [Streptomyces sp. SS8]
MRVSCFFQVKDKDVWNPANLASRTFHAEALALAQIFGVPSGLEPIIDDECRVEIHDFALFIETLLHEHQRTSHAVLRPLLKGSSELGWCYSSVPEKETSPSYRVLGIFGRKNAKSFPA